MYSKNQRILLMGSSSFKNEELPIEIKDKLDLGIEKCVIFIVAEAYGAYRLFQDYLNSKNYGNVIVGHAKSIRYNAGSWKHIQYGTNLKEREKNMIEECDHAIVIWQDYSGVIAENLEYMKKLRKPTFLYEFDSTYNTELAGDLDPMRTYRKIHNKGKTMVINTRRKKN